jgi:hypothetical protein
MSLRWLSVIFVLALPTHVGGQEADPDYHQQSETRSRSALPSETSFAEAQESMCLLIEAAAQANGLPSPYFARLIWRESRFRTDAIGPVTRSGAQALGIAQFMPGTARERGLLDPFDPVHALPKAAEFLAELRGELGNLGLAAAAYNEGPRRVREWLDGTGGMPAETRHYVYAITGATVEEWAEHGRDAAALTPTGKRDCRQMMALARHTPTPYVYALEQQVRTAIHRPWGVQLSTGFHRARALASYGRLAQRYRAVLASHEPIVQRAHLRSRGTRALYQIRVGTESRAEAETLCNRLRAAGGACMVLRNRGG